MLPQDASAYAVVLTAAFAVVPGGWARGLATALGRVPRGGRIGRAADALAVAAGALVGLLIVRADAGNRGLPVPPPDAAHVGAAVLGAAAGVLLWHALDARMRARVRAAPPDPPG